MKNTDVEKGGGKVRSRSLLLALERVHRRSDALVALVS